MIFKLKIKKMLGVLFLLLTLNCAKNDPVTGEKILIEPNAEKRAREFADKGGGIFGDINRKATGSTSVDFASSNVMWRATLKTLDFLPLSNTDYSGGIIIYDWYSQPNNPREQIKISVRFLSNELRSDSIKITAHKRICDSADKCSNSTLDEKFSDAVKENIITNARSLKVEEAKKEKK
jgi:hypothetical protein